MFTEESSIEQTPLATEPTVLPEASPNEPFLFPPPPSQPTNARGDRRWDRLLLAIGTWFISLLLLLFVPLIVAAGLIIAWREHRLTRPDERDIARAEGT